MDKTTRNLGIGVEQAGADGCEGRAALGAAVGSGADGGGREDARRRDTAGDALGQVTRADEAQAEGIPVHGRGRRCGLERRRRHCEEGDEFGEGASERRSSGALD